MVLVEQYVEFYEAENVSSLWKWCQIAIYFICALTSICASYCFGYLYTYIFENNCLLYSNITLLTQNIDRESVNASTTLFLTIGLVDTLKSEWGNIKTCNFGLFSLVCSFIFSFIWATFFTMCGKGGKTTRGLSSPWRIVFPAFIFNIIYCIISILISVNLQKGIAVFCDNLKKNMNTDDCEASLHNLDRSPRKNSHMFFTLSKVFAWGTSGMWASSILLLLFRCICISDFDLYRIQILTSSNDNFPAARPEVEPDPGEGSSRKVNDQEPAQDV